MFHMIEDTLILFVKIIIFMMIKSSKVIIGWAILAVFLLMIYLRARVKNK